MQQDFPSAFARTLLDPDQPPPEGVVAPASVGLDKRFAVYRNNVMVGLVSALEARFPATRRIVGEEFFTAMARVHAAASPPRSPLMMFYGDEFPDFIAGFEPAAELPYLADVARLEAARTRAYHAADREPLGCDALSRIGQNGLDHLRLILHPSVEIVVSAFPIVTLWAMNAGEAELAPVTDWSPEAALVRRPHLDVLVSPLPEAAATFLESLRRGVTLASAATEALQRSPGFDLARNIAGLFDSGLLVGWHCDES